MVPLTLLKFLLKAGKARRFRFQDSGPILLFADLARGAVGTQAVSDATSPILAWIIVVASVSWSC